MAANSWAGRGVSMAGIALMIALPMGLLFWAILALVGLAAVEAGRQGFRAEGYAVLGNMRLTGRAARLVGGFALGLGILWEVMLAAILVLGPARF